MSYCLFVAVALVFIVSSRVKGIKTTARQKAEFLDLVEAYNMDRFSIAAKTVELVINGDALGGTNDVEEKDWRQIDSIGWLTQDKGLFIQAAFRSHQIARRFLSKWIRCLRGPVAYPIPSVRRRLASARLLLDSIPEDLIAPQLMRDISESADVRAEYQAVGNVEQRLQVDLAMEGLFLRQLVTALEDYQNWRETMARKPIPGFEEGRETRSLRRNEQAARQRDKAAWESEARALTVRAAQELDALLNIGFFVDKGWSMSLQGIESKRLGPSLSPAAYNLTVNGPPRF